MSDLEKKPKELPKEASESKLTSDAGSHINVIHDNEQKKLLEAATKNNPDAIPEGDSVGSNLAALKPGMTLSDARAAQEKLDVQPFIIDFGDGKTVTAADKLKVYGARQLIAQGDGREYMPPQAMILAKTARVQTIMGRSCRLYEVFVSPRRQFTEMKKLLLLSLILMLALCSKADCRQPTLTEKDQLYWLLREAHYQPYESGLKTYEKAIRSNPKNAQVYEARAMEHESAGKFPLAIADCDKAIELDPDDEYPWLIRARCHFWSKRFNEAIKDINSFEEHDHGDRSYIRHEVPLIVGASNYHLGDYKRAIEQLTRAEHSDAGSKSADAFYYRALCYIALNDWANALKDLNVAIRLRPYIPEYRLARAKAYSKLGRTKLANQDLGAARNVPKDNKLPRYGFL